MQSQYLILCPFLESGPNGAFCLACNKLVRDMPDGNTKLCMSSHYEICSDYILSLFQKPFPLSPMKDDN